MAAGFRRGRFFLHTRLGAGGMGEVWLAREATGPGTGATVAVKMLLPHLAEDARFVSLLRHEAARAAMLRHPGIVRVRGIEEVDGSLLLVMEHVPGPSLRWVLERSRALGRPLPAGFVARAMTCVCEALHHAHQAGLVHADVAPDNVLVTPSGDVKVVDFGVARLLHAEDGAPRAGRTGYTAPEVQAGEVPREPADLYALGAMLRELAGASDDAGALEPLARPALETDPKARPASTLALREALAPGAAPFDSHRLGRHVTLLLAAEPPRPSQPGGATTTGVIPSEAPVPSLPPTPRPWTWRGKVLVLVALAFGLALLGLLFDR